MSKRKTIKKIPTLEPKFHDILVCKKNNCRPFMEIMVEEPENVSHQSLGVLIGVFQIDDRSEDSSYVVNYLISVIKKEYFSRTNRGPVENFEAALHKANLALAKLATHESIGWIGRINAVCAVIEKNNLLLSQTGNISALLLRGSTVMEITEPPEDINDSNPLKTFQDVVSGKIENGDKLLVATKEIFDIFSLEEIKKSALKFPRENFIRFLNTALVNELEQAAALIIDIDEKVEEVIETPLSIDTEEVNAFSQTAFQKKPSPKAEKRSPERQGMTTEEKQRIICELPGKNDGFIDQKTGHIYIKEPDGTDYQPGILEKTIDLSAMKEKLSDLSFFFSESFSRSKKSVSKGTSLLRDKFSDNLARMRANRKKIAPIGEPEKSITRDEPATIIPEELADDRETIDNAGEKPVREFLAAPTAETIKTGPGPAEKISLFWKGLELKTKFGVLAEKIRVIFSWIQEKSVDLAVIILRVPTRLALKLKAEASTKWKEWKEKHVTEITPAADSGPKKPIYPWEKTAAPQEAAGINQATATGRNSAPIALPALLDKASVLLPHLSRLKGLYHRFNYKQKLSALGILILLLVVPYWIAKWENKPEEKPVVVETPPPAPPLENDPNVKRISDLQPVRSGSTARLVDLNENIFAIDSEGQSVIDLAQDKSYSIPDNVRDPDLFFGMDDLKLLFLTKGSNTVSLSPITGKFQDSPLALPSGAKIVAARAYLTYAYLLDTKNSQIYRVPRGGGSFQEGKAWLKEQIDLSAAKDLAVDENIFVLDGKDIIKLSSGKKVAFSLENTATPLSPDKLYARSTGTDLYILDKTNSRIVRADQDGKIIAQYYNPTIAGATDFSISEDNATAYISDNNGVNSFSIR